MDGVERWHKITTPCISRKAICLGKLAQRSLSTRQSARVPLKKILPFFQENQKQTQANGLAEVGAPENRGPENELVSDFLVSNATPNFTPPNDVSALELHFDISNLL